MSNNRSPILARNVDDAINSFHEEEGLALIFANSNKDDVINNTSQAERNFKNGMAVAFEIGKNEIFSVAAVPEGHSKIVSTSTTNIGYFKGTGESSTKSNKAWHLTSSGELIVVFGNNSNAQWQEKNYTAYSFKDDIPSNRGPGLFETKNGWICSMVAQISNGIDDLSDKYIKVRNSDDDIKDYIELNSIDVVSQSTNICGSGNEQRTGTCCLYYKENHYDSVAGVTYAPGEYYKCTCTKCYRCLELAQAMNMKYVFNPFIGGTGDECLNCTDDNFPTNCGPCSCKIEVVDGNDSILNDINLPVNGTAKQNALYSNWWKNTGNGMVFIHLTSEFTDLHSSVRKINKDWHDKEKVITLIEGSQDPNKTNTVYHLTVVGSKGESYVSGISAVSYGQYTSIPKIDITLLREIWPNADEKYFRIVMVPDLHKDIHQLLPKQLMIRKTINLSEIAELTAVDTFDSYGIGTLITQDGGKYFSDSSKVTRSARLTFKNELSVDTSGSPSLSNDQWQSNQLLKKTKYYKNDNDAKYSSVAGFKHVSGSNTIFEFYAGNLDNDTTTNMTFTDEQGDVFTTTSSIPPTNKKTGEILDAQSTKLYHQNSTKINIPDQAKLGSSGIGHSLNVVFEVIVGTGNNLF